VGVQSPLNDPSPVADWLTDPVERPEADVSTVADDTKLAVPRELPVTPEAKDALTDPVVDTDTEPLGVSVTDAETETEGESDELPSTLALGGL
jgi:hypothetical protein